MIISRKSEFFSEFVSIFMEFREEKNYSEFGKNIFTEKKNSGKVIVECGGPAAHWSSGSNICFPPKGAAVGMHPHLEWNQVSSDQFLTTLVTLT
jgi:hypothetical protein